RGGLGEELALYAFDDGRLDAAAPIVLSGSAGRMQFPPAGLFGGGPGALGRILVNDVPIAPSSSPEVTFRAGDRVRLLLPGGGGYGDPRRRERALVDADIMHGYVTPEGARRDYGHDPAAGGAPGPGGGPGRAREWRGA